MRLDLHVHSTASDGMYGPAEVVALAAEGGLDVIALADHDTVAGVEAAREVASTHAMQVIPAVEMSSTRGSREIHILGYFVDPSARSISDHRKRAGELRESRMVEMVDRLRREGLDIDMERVLKAAGPECAALGRPHLARALVDAGHVGSVGEVFDRWIGDGLPAHVPTRLLDPASAIQVILESGGIPVWAHPPLDLIADALPEMVRQGLRGLEVYRPRARPDQMLLLEQQARTRGLLVSGGSDWHGDRDGVGLGDFSVSSEEVRELLDAGGL